MMLVLLVCAAALCGCGAAGTTSTAEEGVKIDGKTLLLTLRENPTTGYTWQYAVSDPNVLAFTNDIYSPDENSDNKTGVGGLHAYTFTGKSEGSVTLTMTEGQHWEGGATSQTKVYTVTVKADGTIANAQEEAAQ